MLWLKITSTSYIDLETSLAMKFQMSLQATEHGIIVSKKKEKAFNDLHKPERLAQLFNFI